VEAKTEHDRSPGIRVVAASTVHPVRVSSGTRELSRDGGGDTVASTLSRAVSGARMGDPDALSFLYARYAEDVYSHIRVIVEDHEMAIDITQRVFAGLRRLPNRIEDGEIPFSLWIQDVARDLATETIDCRSLASETSNRRDTHRDSYSH
jgi:DNA-directed RNA polymerase specialized sigma24 family protein